MDLSNKPKRKTIQFEEEEKFENSNNKPIEQTTISSPNTNKNEKSNGILKKRSLPQSQDSHSQESISIEKIDKEEELASGVIPLLNLNVKENPNENIQSIQNNNDKVIVSSPHKKFQIKRNKIEKIPEDTLKKFDNLNKNLVLLKNKENNNENKDIKKFRVPQDADYIEENISKPLREALNELFTQK